MATRETPAGTLTAPADAVVWDDEGHVIAEWDAAPPAPAGEAFAVEWDSQGEFRMVIPPRARRARMWLR